MDIGRTKVTPSRVTVASIDMWNLLCLKLVSVDRGFRILDHPFGPVIPVPPVLLLCRRPGPGPGHLKVETGDHQVATARGASKVGHI